MRYLTGLLVAAALTLSAGAQTLAARNALPQSASGQQQETEEKQSGYSISVTVPVVNVDVVVTDNDGNYLTGLKKENFCILEDGQRQTISNFDTTEAPITTVMLLEYSKLGSEWFLENAKNWGRAFLRQLKPTDWVALTSFSMRPKVEVDFTHSQPEIEQALASMIYPGFSEANLFDALGDTLDRLNHVKSRKSILILASGLDTFSRTNLDEVLDQLRQSDVTVYVVGVAEQFFLAEEMRGGVSSVGRLTYYQAQSRLRSFAELTGGRAWFPKFEGEIPGIMGDIAARIRSQYSLAYTPTNKSMDGKYRKIKVELLAVDGSPLTTVVDRNGKKRKVVVYARQGYLAPKSDLSD